MSNRRTILVTGCSSGIGAHCATALKADGWDVFATARRPEDIARLEAAGFQAHYLDYREPKSIEALADAVLSQTGGKLDALFNNGGHAQPGAVEDLPMDALRAQFEASFFGWQDLTRRVVPVMRRQGRGRIVHTSSILGLVPMKWRGAYVAAKFALEGLMTVQRMELEGSGVHVSLIEPGPIESRIAANSVALVERYIDVEGSVHRDEYRRQMEQFGKDAAKSKATLGPGAIYVVLKEALENPRPKPHYVVTTPAKLGVLAKRILPPTILYRLLASGS